MTNQPDHLLEDRLDDDLHSLYRSIAVPPLTFDPPVSRVVSRTPGTRSAGRLRTPRIALLGVAAAVVAAGLAAFTLLPLGSGSVASDANAENILQRSGAAASLEAAAGNSVPYHIVARRGSPVGGKGNETIETWVQDATHFSTEHRLAEAAGPQGVSFGVTRDAADVWLFTSDETGTRAVHGPASSVSITLPETAAGASSLGDVLNGYSKSGCFDAHSQATDTVLGRAVYVIVVSPTSGGCDSDGAEAKAGLEAGATTTVWVDQQTFLPLRSQSVHLGDGRVLWTYDVTEIQVGDAVAATDFRYHPPSGVTVVDVSDTASAKQALSSGSHEKR